MGRDGGLEIRAENVVCTFNSFNLEQCPSMTASLHICSGYFELHAGAKPPLKSVIQTKFTYLLHLSSFLGQTFQIDFNCWPGDFKFSFDAKCQIMMTQGLTSPK